MRQTKKQKIAKAGSEQQTKQEINYSQSRKQKCAKPGSKK